MLYFNFYPFFWPKNLNKDTVIYRKFWWAEKFDSSKILTHQKIRFIKNFRHIKYFDPTKYICRQFRVKKLYKLTDDFLPLVDSFRPSNSRWTRLVNRFSARKLRGGKCFKSGTLNGTTMALVSSASNFDDFVSLFHSLIDSTMKNCKSNESWHNRLNSAAEKFNWAISCL